MSSLEEIKAAAAKLNPEEQVELFKWWTSTETFRARQLASLKRDLSLGIDQLESGHYQAYTNDNLMRLAEEVGRLGRRRSKASRNNPAK